MSAVTEKHPDAVRKVLKRARMSEGSELDSAQLERVKEAVRKTALSGDRLYHFILQGNTEAPKSTARARTRDAGTKSQAKQIRPKYPPLVKAAAKRVRELSGGKGSPGAKQVDLVLQKLHGRSAIEVSGLAERTLRSYAKGTTKPKALPASMLELAAECDDSFCRGRRLAMILAAIAEQEKSSAQG